MTFKTMNKKDIIAALVIGEISAWLILAIAKNLVAKLPVWWLLPIVFPILCAGGMTIALFFEKKLAILYQFAKFVLVGGFNTLIDLGIFNLLIFASGIAVGFWYSVFKGISFLVATTNSYFWNKLWTFKHNGTLLHSSIPVKKKEKESGQFLTISIVGFLINVGVASLIVNVIGPSSLQSMPKDMYFIRAFYNQKLWANVGAIAGSIMGLMWNFIGYKFIVFK